MPTPAQLLQTIQLVIDRHGKDNPDLKADLEALRSDIEKAGTRSPAQLMADALRIGSFAKWVLDHLPDIPLP